MMDEREYQKRVMVRDMLGNELFSAILNEVSKSVMIDILMTKPDEASRREELYCENQALTRLVGRFQSFANEASMVERDRNKKQAGVQ